MTLKLKTSPDPQPDFLALPWSEPLARWPEELAVRLPTGRHRHVVRFIECEGRYFACKELTTRLALREFTLLQHLKDESLPVVDLVGVALDRRGADGTPLDAVLITRHLPYSLPYFHLFTGPNTEGLHTRLIDALAVLLCRLHLGGFFWGDCSLGNVLFRRDVGALAAYVVDTETGETHDALTDGQRQLDLDIAAENIVGGLFELEAIGRLGIGVDPVELTEQLLRRYRSLWDELTRIDELDPTELWRVHDRLCRLNDLGFDTAEVELRGDETRRAVRFRPVIVEEGHHRRELGRLTGIEAEENQARRLLSDIRGFSAGLAAADRGAPQPEAVVAYRWLAERYRPTVGSVPAAMRGRLTEAELFNQILDHLWFLSEADGRDVGLPTATRSYLARVLADLPQEAAVIGDADPDSDDPHSGRDPGPPITRIGWPVGSPAGARAPRGRPPVPDTTSYTGFDTTTEEPGILVVTFNRPQTLNAATQPMKRDLVEVLTQAQMDDGVRVVVFTGTGTGFWAGDDLSDGYKDAPTGVMPRIHGGHHTPTGTYNGLRVLSQAVNVAVRNLDKLTIAAINGFAIQTGFSLALACDFRIAAKGARMGSATLRFGLLPDEGGQYLLVQHLGVAGAMDFLMRKRIVEAETAHELGLVNEVVEPDRLMPAALDLARELADGPQMAMRMLKRSVYLAAEQTFSHALEDIAARTAVTDHLPDATEGMRAFREKRSATFNQGLGGRGTQ